MGIEDGLKNLKRNLRQGLVIGLTAAGSILPSEKAEAQIFRKDHDKKPKTEHYQEQKSPFDTKLSEMQKKYLSDSTYYRAVSVGQSIDQMTSMNESTSFAMGEIMKQANAGKISNVRVIEQRVFQDSNGTYKTIAAIEVLKSDVK